MQHQRLAVSLCLAGTALASIVLAGCAGGQSAVTGQASPLPSTLSSPPQAAESSGPPDASLTGLHPCTLIPAAVVARELGRLASPPSESANGFECIYFPVALEGKGTEVILTVMNRSSFDQGRAMDEAAEKKGVLRILPAHGIGDDGFITQVSVGRAAFSLTVAKAGRAINIAVVGQGEADEQRVRSLMVAAIGSL